MQVVASRLSRYTTNVVEHLLADGEHGGSIVGVIGGEALRVGECGELRRVRRSSDSFPTVRFRNLPRG